MQVASRFSPPASQQIDTDDSIQKTTLSQGWITPVGSTVQPGYLGRWEEDVS